MNVKSEMKRRRLTRAESQERTRTALIEAAIDVFSRRGFYEATIEEIVDVAGYSRGAFYANFADKADLYMAAVDSEQQREFADVGSLLQASSEEDQVLPVLYGWFRKSLAVPLDRANAEFRLAAMNNPQHRQRLAENLAMVRALTADLVAQYCKRRGVKLKIDYPIFAAMVIATVDGFAAHLRLDPKAVRPETIATALTALWEGAIEQS